MFADLYQNEKVLVTGHTGFKGSWLSAWLTRLGAEICGVSLPERTDPNHFDLLDLSGLRSEFLDIRRAKELKAVFASFQPSIVFHLAAQPLVRLSYEQPAETFETNLMGTVNVLEAVRQTPSVRAVIVVTSDKCYENFDLDRGYRESDPMGGYDPYSASKGCTELIAASYRRSFLAEKNILLATARSGNVIGGGDWGKDRLIPGLAAAASRNETEPLRSPNATRPWQHVLESLSGYLFLGERLLEGRQDFAEAWNFGPENPSPVSVLDAAKLMNRFWNKIKFESAPDAKNPHEAGKLQLDCTKAFEKLKWKPVWNTEKTFEKTACWYRDYYSGNGIRTRDDLDSYFADAMEKRLSWIR